MNLKCDPCLNHPQLQTAIWQNGDRYYGLQRMQGAKTVTIGVSSTCRYDKRFGYYLTGHTKTRQVTIQKGERWVKLKARMPAWAMSLVL